MNNEDKLKLVLGVLLSGFLVYTFYRGYSGENVIWFVVIDIILAGLLIVSNFQNKIQELIKKTPKKAEPVSLEKMRQMIFKTMQGTAEDNYDGYMRNVKQIIPFEQVTEKKQMIYAFLVTPSYPIKINDNQEEDIFIIINATYPSNSALVKSGKISREELRETMKNLCSDYESPDMEIVETKMGAWNQPETKATRIIQPKTKEEEEDKNSL